MSLLTNLIDDTVSGFLMIFVTNFLKEDNKKQSIIVDMLVAVVVGIFGVMFRSISIAMWVLSSIFYQKLRYHQLDYDFLNSRLFAIIVSYAAVIISDAIETAGRFLLKRFSNINLSNDFGAYVYIVLYIIIEVSFIVRFKRTSIYRDLREQLTDIEISRTVFKILLFSLFSFVTILFISQVAMITAIIQIPLAIIFFIFFGFTFIQLFAFIKSYSYKKEAENQIVQNQQLEEYLNNIEQQYQDLRRFKHDYNNMLLALGEFAKKDNQQQFREYYQELVEKRPVTDRLQRLTISHVDNLRNEPLKGLIIQKFFAAQKLGVTLQIEIDDEITITNTGILPIVRIVGIFLDNAIEHVAEDKVKEVECAFIKSSDLIEITVSNRAPNLKNINQLFQNGYTTKVNHAGFGLANVEELVSKNKSLLLENSLNEGILQITLIIRTGE